MPDRWVPGEVRTVKRDDWVCYCRCSELNMCLGCVHFVEEEREGEEEMGDEERRGDGRRGEKMRGGKGGR